MADSSRHNPRQFESDVAEKFQACNIGVAESVETWEEVPAQVVQVKKKPKVKRKRSKRNVIDNPEEIEKVVKEKDSICDREDATPSSTKPEMFLRSQSDEPGRMHAGSGVEDDGGRASGSKEDNHKLNVNITRAVSMRSAIPLKAMNGIYGSVQRKPNTQITTFNIPDELEQEDYGTWDVESSLSDPLSWLNEPLFQMMGDDDFADRDEDGEGEERTSAMDFVRSQRTLWAHVNRVVDSKIVAHLSKKDVAFQESKFEILTSEASYLKSLNVLKTHFLESPEFNNATIVPTNIRMEIIANIKPIRKCSKAFLHDLEKCWHDSIFLPDIFNVICKHSKIHFKCYVTYCSHLKAIQEKLSSLLKNEKYVDALTTLEGDERCSRLQLDSFLRLPLDRITKLPLPVEKALKTLKSNQESYGTVDYESERACGLLALDYLRLVVDRCNTVTGTNNRVLAMMDLQKKLKFPSNVQPTPLISPNRWLQREDDLKSHNLNKLSRKVSTVAKRKSILSFQKSSTTRTLFMLNDMLILTKRIPNSEFFEVKDYCKKENAVTSLAIWMDKDGEYVIVLIFKENHDNKKVEMILSFTVESVRDEWIEKFNEKTVKIDENKDKKMVCVYSFMTSDPTQLHLEKGDEVTITKTLDNGWLEGVRMRGNKSGTFPPSRVESQNT